MSKLDLTLEVIPGKLAIVRLSPSVREMPNWAVNGFVSACLLTPEETTIVCSEGVVPAGETAELSWRALRVRGVLEFELVGVLSRLASILAAANVSIFALSTFSTDYFLVKDIMLVTAIQALRTAGYSVI